MTDQQIIQGCLNNNRVCQKALYERYSGQMYSICLRYCSNVSDAQDALQKGFIKVFQYLEKFRGEGELGAWIRRIIIHASLDQISLNKNHFSETIDEKITNETSFDHTEKMTYQELLSLVNQLPEGYKMVFSMYVLDDMSHAEIAETLNITESTSRTQLLKARQYLKSILSKKYDHYL